MRLAADSLNGLLVFFLYVLRALDSVSDIITLGLNHVYRALDDVFGRFTFAEDTNFPDNFLLLCHSGGGELVKGQEVFVIGLLSLVIETLRRLLAVLYKGLLSFN